MSDIQRVEPVEIHYERILFCTDFSPNADHAFSFALASARRGSDSALYILHVLPEPDAQFWRTYLYEIDDVDEKAAQDMNRKIEQTYLEQIGTQPRVHVSIAKGKTEERILSYAEEIGADLLVMGRHGHQAVGVHLFGNVAERVACKAHCPVLIVPPTDAPARCPR